MSRSGGDGVATLGTATGKQSCQMGERNSNLQREGIPLSPDSSTYLEVYISRAYSLVCLLVRKKRWTLPQMSLCRSGQSSNSSNSSNRSRAELCDIPWRQGGSRKTMAKGTVCLYNVPWVCVTRRGQEKQKMRNLMRGDSERRLEQPRLWGFLSPLALQAFLPSICTNIDDYKPTGRLVIQMVAKVP